MTNRNPREEIVHHELKKAYVSAHFFGESIPPKEQWDLMVSSWANNYLSHIHINHLRICIEDAVRENKTFRVIQVGQVNEAYNRFKRSASEAVRVEEEKTKIFSEHEQSEISKINTKIALGEMTPEEGKEEMKRLLST